MPPESLPPESPAAPDGPTSTRAGTVASYSPALPPVDMSLIENRPANVALQLLERVQTSGSREAFRFPVEGQTEWESRTWSQTYELVERLAAGLLALGIEREQRVGIASGTRFEWIVADLAVMCAGAATTTVYPSTIAEDVAYIVGDSECRLVFAEDAEQVAKLREHRSDLSKLDKVVLLEGDPAQDDDWVITLDALGELGSAYLSDHAGVVAEIAADIKPDALATLIYTSGTTGKPKGVRLTHGAWTYEGMCTAVQNILSEDDLQFLWLPMAHSFGKVLLSTQLAIGFATAVDGRVDRIIDNLGVIQPTFMGAAPRIFEKAYSRILSMTASEGGAKEKIFKRAFAVGLDVRRRQRAGQGVPLPLKAQHAVLDRLVFAKIRDRFGGRVRFFISGSAALNRDIAEWFDAAGIVILEGYGLTESAAGSFVNHPVDNRIGTVGPSMPGTEVRLGENDEIQLRGPGVMGGYHNRPEATEAALTEDGWLRTGDKGSLDDDGYLTITGRIKDLFKTSGGKYIAPSAIEAKFKAVCPYASQFLVFGNQRNFCVALVTLDPDELTGWAKENGLGSKAYSDLCADPKTHTMVQGYVEQLNTGLNRWETIKKFEILDHDLSIESGELTPSMKVKRNVVEENYRSEIDAFYS